MNFLKTREMQELKLVVSHFIGQGGIQRGLGIDNISSFY